MFGQVTEVGPADALTTQLFANRFEEWHAEHGRGGTEASKLLYHVGVLYGSRLSQHRYHQQTGEELWNVSGEGSSDACRIAERSVKESYGLEARQIDQEDLIIPGYREQRCTGRVQLAFLAERLTNQALVITDSFGCNVIVLHEDAYQDLDALGIQSIIDDPAIQKMLTPFFAKNVHVGAVDTAGRIRALELAAVGRQ